MTCRGFYFYFGGSTRIRTSNLGFGDRCFAVKTMDPCIYATPLELTLSKISKTEQARKSKTREFFFFVASACTEMRSRFLALKFCFAGQGFWSEDLLSFYRNHSLKLLGQPTKRSNASGASQFAQRSTKSQIDSP